MLWLLDGLALLLGMLLGLPLGEYEPGLELGLLLDELLWDELGGAIPPPSGASPVAQTGR